jgi:hypothetical protein
MVIGKYAEARDFDREGTRGSRRAVGRRLMQRIPQLGFTIVRDVAEELETEVEILGADPLHGQLLAALAQRRERIPQLAAYCVGKVQRDEGSNRLPRR